MILTITTTTTTHQGGELFEYILAHRYLKERDACRLFAQLISGVHYMHQKHIVHRDLKLASSTKGNLIVCISF